MVWVEYGTTPRHNTTLVQCSVSVAVVWYGVVWCDVDAVGYSVM